jgi:hypothetical protein
MNNSRGIFEPQEGFAPAPPSKSPFAVADEGQAGSPFAIVAEPESPFASMKDEPSSRLAGDAGRPAKLPERRPAAGEPPALDARSPFASEPLAQSPFDPPASAVSPFGSAPPPVPATNPASSPFGGSSAAVAEPPAAVEVPPTPEPAPPAPAAAAPAPVASTPVAPAAEPESYESDSRSIRQLELRAIFGVDRELSADEILQRARALPGIRHVARVPAADSGTIEALKRVIGNLGFGAGQVKLYCGSVPIEFIRENSVLLAIQNDGSFAPGVRETLMIVARELGRL